MPKEEVYKAIEGVPQKYMVGFDHPETLTLEMQLGWVEDTYTITQTHEYLMGEVYRLDAEYKRKPLRCNYKKQYLWCDRFWMRPQLKGRELFLQDYDIGPGFRLKLSSFYQHEQVWGQPWPFDPLVERKDDRMGAEEDTKLLKRLDKGPPNAKNRLFCFTWTGGKATEYRAMADKLGQNIACFALEMPGNDERDMDEGYPDGAFAVEVIAMSLQKEMKKPGNNYFFAHSQSTHIAYYVAKALKKSFNVSLRGLFVSSFPVPAELPFIHLDTMLDRQNVCVPLRYFVGYIKQGYGIKPVTGFKSPMGSTGYQQQENWPYSRGVIRDHWMTKAFPLPNSDEPLDCTIVAFHAKDDKAVSIDQVQKWKELASSANKRQFNVIRMDGDHAWFVNSTKLSEDLAKELTKLISVIQ